jgi:hypothetical protein
MYSLLDHVPDHIKAVEGKGESALNAESKQKPVQACAIFLD